MSAPHSLFAGLLCFVFAVAPFQCPSDPDPDKRREETPGEALYDLAGEFKKSGFRGPINRYRNMDRDWEELPQLENARVKQPALFLAGEKDGVIAMSSPETQRQFIDNLTIKLFPGAGHWTQQERPAETNEALISFLKGLP